MSSGYAIYRKVASLADAALAKNTTTSHFAENNDNLERIEILETLLGLHDPHPSHEEDEFKVLSNLIEELKDSVTTEISTIKNEIANLLKAVRTLEINQAEHKNLHEQHNEKLADHESKHTLELGILEATFGALNHPASR